MVGLYSVDSVHSSLISVPFTAVASETLNRLKTPTHDSQLNPTLYVGQCAYGLYAVSSLVDEGVLTISANDPGLFPYLIEGPKNKPETPPVPVGQNESAVNSSAQINETDVELERDLHLQDFVLLGKDLRALCPFDFCVGHS